MTIRNLILTAVLALTASTSSLAEDDYKLSAEYLTLRDSMHHAFNNGDSARFFVAVKNLEDYLLRQGDLHTYYTQRCNEIVFLMNQQKIFEAYKLARQLSTELREKKLDKEMYMAYNMLGHINRYCGNKEAAKRNFCHVLELMEEYGYYESMPPIYMNIVNVELGDDPKEAQRLLEKAKAIAEKYSPERVFDIETRKTLSYFNGGDIPRFLEGYKAYRKGVEEGKSSVHGRSMEIYYLACTGKTDEAVALAKEMGDQGLEAITMIYERSGMWKDAYESLRQETAARDSINNVVLTNSMEGIREQLALYDAERQSSRIRTIAFSIGILLLGMLVAALAYIVVTRRKHLKEMKIAYQHALESDKMKTSFIQNISHEVRTPLNIISGFAQVLSSPDMAADEKERKHIAQMVFENAQLVTSLIDEMLELSLSETSGTPLHTEPVKVNTLMRNLIRDNSGKTTPKTELKYDSLLADDFTFTTNETMVKRIVGTLLDNAAKYTTEGSITLKTAADDEKFTITVEDTGCGVPPEEAERIFERFVKLDSFKEGIGLGLTLCRTLSKRLGGNVLLDTQYTNGARFVVTLPVEGVKTEE